MRTRKTIEIPRTYTSAVGTSLGSHVRIDKDDSLSFSLCLVLDEVLQLKETPMIEPSIQSFSHKLIPALSYSFKVFQYDCVSRSNNLLADFVVHPTHIAFLSARQSFKLPSGGLCAFTLESSPQILELDNLGLVASKNPAVRTDGKIIYSEINTEISVATESAGVFNRCHGLPQVPSDLSGESDMKEHPSFSISDNLKSLVFPIKIFPIIFGNINAKILPLAFDKGGKANFIKRECKKVSVEADRAGFHNWLPFELSGFKIFRSLGNGFTGKISRKPLPQILIDKMMKLESVAYLRFKTFINSILDSMKKSIGHIKQLLVHSDFKLYRGNGLHKVECRYNLYINILEVNWTNSPPL
jgi:hypothetical protein